MNRSVAWGATALGMLALVRATDAQAPAPERAAVEDFATQWSQRAGSPPLEQLRYLLDRGVAGDGLPAPLQSVFAEIFEPAKEQLAKVLEEQFRKAQQQLTIEVRSARRVVTGTRVAADLPEESGGVRWVPAAARSRAGSREALWRGAVRWSQVQAAAAAGTASVSGAADAGNGTTAEFSAGRVTDTDRSVAEGDTFDLRLDGSSKAAKGQLGLGQSDVARVERCPSADGVVPGNSDLKGYVTVSATGADGASQTSTLSFTQHLAAEAHVGDDGVIREARADFETTASASYPVATTLRAAGTATWDPHGTADPTVVLKSCTASDGMPVAPPTCRLLGTVLTGRLTRTYVRAENQWNFVAVDAYGNAAKSSKCVTVEFAPKTETARGKPNESVSVATRLVTVDGRQATSGTLDQLAPVRGGEAERDGATVTSSAPAPLVYHTPAQPWALSQPPGFDVVRAKSRAGAFMREHAEEREYRWLLKPGPKLTIHNLWQSGLPPYGTLLSEATFTIELKEGANGELSGQAVVPRRYHTAGVCTDDGHWTETWQADAKYDDSGDNLILKIRYRASQKEAVGVCPEVGAKAHTLPALSSEGVRTPLDNFTLPMQEGATRQFAFTSGAVAKNVIDVTIARADDSRR